MAADKLLALLAGHDSKKPMAFDDIVAASGLQAETVQMLMDHLFHSVPSAVNRAEITRSGKTQMFYWPTGVVVNIGAGEFGRQPIKRPSAQPPRMQHTPPTAPITNRMAEKAVDQMEGILNMDTKPQDKKPGRIIMQLLAEKREVSAADLQRAAGISGVDKYIQGKLKHGLVVKDGNMYRVADGVPPEMLLSNLPRGKSAAPYHAPETKNAPESGVASAQSERSEKPSEQLNKPDGMGSPQAERDEGAKGMEIPEASTAQPSSTVREFKRPECPLPGGEGRGWGKGGTEIERQYTAHQVSIDATGQLVIQQPGVVRMVFPPEDTRRIQKLLLAIDLESLCA